MVVALVTIVASLAAGAASWRLAAAERGAGRRAWAAIGLAMVLGAAANVYWIIAGLSELGDSLETVVNIVWSVILIAVLVGEVALLRARMPGRVVEVLADATVIGLLPAIVTWELGAQVVEADGQAVLIAVTLLNQTVAWVQAVIAVRLTQDDGANRFILVVTVSLIAGATSTTLTVVAVLVGASGASTVGLALGVAALRTIGTLPMLCLPFLPEARTVTRRGATTPPVLAPFRGLTFGVCGAAIPLGLGFGRTGPIDRIFYAAVAAAFIAAVVARFSDLLRERDLAIARERAVNTVMSERATTDSLTLLPNRQWLADHLTDLLAAGDSTCAVLFMDLDDFKVINDSFGHDAGDLVLTAVAARLREARRGDEAIARFGGDEFVIVVPGCIDPDGAAEVARRYADAAARLEIVSGVEVNIQPSIGIAMRQRGSTASSLIRDADAAMYAAKRQRLHAVAFTDELRGEVLDGLRVEQALRRSLETSQTSDLSVVYQPIVGLLTGGCVGAEALARWPASSPPVGPDVFVPAAERSGLIHDLGTLVLARAAAAWQAASSDGSGCPISINVSARELVRATYASELLAILEAVDMPTDQLTLELTERDVAEPVAIDVLGGLRREGVKVAVDDFGTGYFSLSQLRTVPIDAVKIDRTFVADMVTDPAARAIVQACVNLGEGLGLAVVAEGVETDLQRRQLLDLGCILGQGHLFGQPTATLGAMGLRQDAGVLPRWGS